MNHLNFAKEKSNFFEFVAPEKPDDTQGRSIIKPSVRPNYNDGHRFSNPDHPTNKEMSCRFIQQVKLNSTSELALGGNTKSAKRSLEVCADNNSENNTKSESDIPPAKRQKQDHFSQYEQSHLEVEDNSYSTRLLINNPVIAYLLAKSGYLDYETVKNLRLTHSRFATAISDSLLRSCYKVTLVATWFSKRQTKFNINGLTTIEQAIKDILIKEKRSHSLTGKLFYRNEDSVYGQPIPKRTNLLSDDTCRILDVLPKKKHSLFFVVFPKNDQ